MCVHVYTQSSVSVFTVQGCVCLDTWVGDCVCTQFVLFYFNEVSIYLVALVIKKDCHCGNVLLTSSLFLLLYFLKDYKMLLSRHFPF